MLRQNELNDSISRLSAQRSREAEQDKFWRWEDSSNNLDDTKCQDWPGFSLEKQNKTIDCTDNYQRGKWLGWFHCGPLQSGETSSCPVQETVVLEKRDRWSSPDWGWGSGSSLGNLCGKVCRLLSLVSTGNGNIKTETPTSRSVSPCFLFSSVLQQGPHPIGWPKFQTHALFVNIPHIRQYPLPTF